MECNSIVCHCGFALGMSIEFLLPPWSDVTWPREFSESYLHFLSFTDGCAFLACYENKKDQKAVLVDSLENLEGMGVMYTEHCTKKPL